jgi:hypothetical protein
MSFSRLIHPAGAEPAARPAPGGPAFGGLCAAASLAEAARICFSPPTQAGAAPA